MVAGGVIQEVLDLLQLVHGLIRAGHVLEGIGRHILGQLLGLGTADAKHATSTLLRKPEVVKADIDLLDVGFDIPNEFVIGYGLDYAERYRDLPYVGTLHPDVYTTN